MSRLADRLAGLDRITPRYPRASRVPDLSGWTTPGRQWRLLGPLVILVGLMGAVGVTMLIRPIGMAPASPAPATVSHAPPLSEPYAPAPAPAADRFQLLLREGTEAARGGRVTEAARLLLEALAIDERHAGAWNNLGVALTRQGESAQGIAAFRRALRLDAAHAEAHRNLAVVLDRRGQPAEAARHYRAYLILGAGDDPGRAEVSRRLAELGSGRGAP
jgi:predicted TPR repeat methyltransferase